MAMAEPVESRGRKVPAEETPLPDRVVDALATVVYRRRIMKEGPEAAIGPYVERARVQVPRQRRSPDDA